MKHALGADDLSAENVLEQRLQGSLSNTQMLDPKNLRALCKLRKTSGPYVFETELRGPMTVATLQYLVHERIHQGQSWRTLDLFGMTRCGMPLHWAFPRHVGPTATPPANGGTPILAEICVMRKPCHVGDHNRLRANRSASLRLTGRFGPRSADWHNASQISVSGKH